MKRFYLKIILTLQLLVLLAIALLYLASRPETTEFIGEKILKPQGIGYSEVKGTLYEGLTLYDVNISEGIRAAELTVRYKIGALLLGRPRIKEVTIRGLDIRSSQLQSDEEGPAWGIPPFEIEKLQLKEGYINDDVNVTFSLVAKRVAYDGSDLAVERLHADLMSAYGRVVLDGGVKDNLLKGKAHATPSAVTQSYYTPYADTPQERFEIDVEALGMASMRLRTRVPHIRYPGDTNITAEDVDAVFDYTYARDDFDLTLAYRLCAPVGCTNAGQFLRIGFDGRYEGTLDAAELTAVYPLPFEKAHASYRGGSEGMTANIAAGALDIRLQSRDYTTYGFRVLSDALSLRFLEELPAEVTNAPLKLDVNGSVRIDDAIAFGGDVAITTQKSEIRGSFGYADNAFYSDANLSSPSDSALVRKLGAFNIMPLHLVFCFADEKAALLAESSTFNLTLLKEEERLRGWGGFHNAGFDVEGSVDDEGHLSAEIASRVPSLFALADAITPLELEDYEFYDAELLAQTRVEYRDALRVESTITVPWYALVFDSKSRFYGSESTASFTLEENSITLDNYSIDVVNRHIFSQRPSPLRVDENLTLHLEPLWVFDNLQIRGRVSDGAKEVELHLFSDGFSYKGPEGSLQLAADARLGMDAEGEQRLEGHVKILEGLITYVPVNDVVVNDDDIIIIQDVRPPSKIKRFINLHVTSEQGVRYETPQVEVSFRPDVTLWREPGSSTGLLGMLSIEQGRFESSGKEFAIKPSHLYFGGSYPVNPYLDLYADYVYEEILFHIYITHTLESPVFLFNSEPSMSQNDIMSYILFGKPANEMFGSTEGGSSSIAAANLLLGTGLKDMIGDTTGIKVDTLNLISSPEGEFGFEVGARLHKDVRVVYKNDTVSNLMLQYRLNRWLRLDVEVYETGQGVNMIYVKDFKAFERE